MVGGGSQIACPRVRERERKKCSMRYTQKRMEWSVKANARNWKRQCCVRWQQAEQTDTEASGKTHTAPTNPNVRDSTKTSKLTLNICRIRVHLHTGLSSVFRINEIKDSIANELSPCSHASNEKYIDSNLLSASSSISRKFFLSGFRDRVPVSQFCWQCRRMATV